MCLACEQDAIWFAYLESQGLLKPEDPAAVNALFQAFPVQPLPMQQQGGAQGPNERAKAPEKKTFSCDDPTAE